MAGVPKPRHLLPQVQIWLQENVASRRPGAVCQLMIGQLEQAQTLVSNASSGSERGEAGEPCMKESAAGTDVKPEGGLLTLEPGPLYQATSAKNLTCQRRHGHFSPSGPSTGKDSLHNVAESKTAGPDSVNADVGSKMHSTSGSIAGMHHSKSFHSLSLPFANQYTPPFSVSAGGRNLSQSQSLLLARMLCSKTTAVESNPQDTSLESNGSKDLEALKDTSHLNTPADQDVLTDALRADGSENSDILMEHLDMNNLDHPTDADLDRALGEPTSNTSASDTAKNGSTPKVSIEATKLFNRVWNQVVSKMGGIESLNIPKEIVWLNGAPGSGKGANTPFILQTRGFPTKAISISSLLQDDKQAQQIMDSGALLSDSHVLELVLEGILRMGFMDSPDEEGDEIPDEDEIIAGVVVDGFPRTTMQVDFVKLLNDKLADLHYQHLNTPSEHHFPRPIFRIAVLYVEEEESVRRQLHRGKAALQHNQRVKESGLGELVEVRETDLDERAARRRYQIFREHYDTLLRLKSFFPFHLIDAMGTLAQCREQIADELQYQSGLELGEDTFRAICHLPLAKNLVKQARQNMVTRLDAYMKHDLNTFRAVTDVIEHEVIPIVRKCALAGVALYNTEKPLFFEYPEASEMLADVLSERGYYVTWQTRTREIPVKVDLKTGAITCEKRVSLQFRIKFDRPIIRNPTLNPTADDKS